MSEPPVGSVDGEDVGGQDGIGHGLVLVGSQEWSGLI
jgi:hypothetical protein